ncbi:hypothetical protein [Rhizobium giardinii]|uniref:Uncharacterized protein n=1 Tax=Rhizobium giardinii TaxID=56731 RepID=A0A7W8X810_9HYPH|nr:hypothetical protein [Rhizobium giardinii]MBB5536840.1 hypothetical protein [Rhizobium giardinii]
MNVDNLYPSNYVRSEDLKGRRHTLTIDRIAVEDVGDDRDKPVIYFKGARKGLVLNKTNAMVIAEVYGKNTESWSGQPLELYVARVNFQGRMVDGIRVDVPALSKTEEAKPDQKPNSNLQEDDLNGSLPF